MLTVTIGNSISLITGVDKDQFKQLRDVLSYTIDSNQIFFSGGWRSPKKYLLSRKGEFPTGLLYLVQGYMTKCKLPCKWIDKRVRPESQPGLFKLSLGVTPYPEQENAATACLERYRGIICAPTGVGKSLIIALIINKLQVPTLVVVPSLEIKRQLNLGLSEAFGKENVGPNKPIWVENVDALSINNVVIKYSCVIIDEFHHSGAKTYRKLNEKAWTNIYYRFGLTATPFRSKSEEKILLESVLAEVIYKVDYTAAVDKGYIVPMEAYYFELPRKEVESNTQRWASIYSELVVNYDKRNQLIAHLLRKFHANDIATLCLVKEITHGNNINSLTGASFANGTEGECQQLIAWFNSGRLKTLKGPVGVLGEGVDTKPAEFVIIAGLGKSRNQFMQQVGRGFRRYKDKDSCKVILILDKSHKWCIAHFKEQVKILREEYGVAPVKLPLPEGIWSS